MMMCGGWTPTSDELHPLDYDYPINKYARAMCRVGHTLKKMMYDDVPTDNERLLVDSDIKVDSDDMDFEVGYLSTDVKKEYY